MSRADGNQSCFWPLARKRALLSSTVLLFSFCVLTACLSRNPPDPGVSRRPSLEEPRDDRLQLPQVSEPEAADPQESADTREPDPPDFPDEKTAFPASDPDLLLGQRAEALASAIASLPGILDAIVLLKGSTALVGIRPGDSGRSMPDMEEISRQINQQLRQRDRLIERVIVTADPELLDPMREIAVKVRQGQPVADFQDHFDRLAARASSGSF